MRKKHRCYIMPFRVHVTCPHCSCTTPRDFDGLRHARRVSCDGCTANFWAFADVAGFSAPNGAFNTVDGHHYKDDFINERFEKCEVSQIDN